jgi:hypothetical protein
LKLCLKKKKSRAAKEKMIRIGVDKIFELIPQCELGATLSH